MEGSLSDKHSILPLVNNGTAEKRFKFFCRFFLRATALVTSLTFHIPVFNAVTVYTV